MDVEQKMYTTLFNSITDANKLLEQATEILKKAQADAEEIYIKKEDTPNC